MKVEGFFLALLKNSRDPGNASSKTIRLEKAGDHALAVIKPWLNNADNLFYYLKEDQFLALPAVLTEDLHLLAANLHLRKSGLRLGAIMKNNLVPDHELALS